MIIRMETPADYQQVYDVNALAFNQTSESILVDNLRLDEAFIKELSIVAEIDNRVVGHILFTAITLDSSDSEGLLALAPMAVHPDYQNRQIGSQLIRYGIQEAKRLGYKGIIVLGHKEYYPKFGFVPASNYDIKCPFDVPDEVFMAMALEEGSLKDYEGTVVYASPFNEV